MNGVTKVAKYASLTLNVLICLSGAVMIIAGCIIQAKIMTQYLSRTVGGYNTQSGAIICISFGSFILVISLLGFYSALKDKTRLLIGYSIILALIFVVQIVTGIAGLVVSKRNNFNDQVERNFASQFRRNATRLVERDRLQIIFQCCGWQSMYDYNNNFGMLDAPPSCCIRRPTNQTQCATDNPRDLFKQSCNMKITDAVRVCIEVVCVILVIFAILNFSSIVIAFLLNRLITSGYQAE